MFVMISPLQAHLHETLTSLKFATKVNGPHLNRKEFELTGARSIIPTSAPQRDN